jgi:hypothetical protein
MPVSGRLLVTVPGAGQHRQQHLALRLQGGQAFVAHARRFRVAVVRVQAVQQDPLQRPLEQVDPVVGRHEHGDVLLEPPVLRWRQRAQRGKRDLDDRQACVRVELRDHRSEPEGLLEHARVGGSLQVLHCFVRSVASRSSSSV